MNIIEVRKIVGEIKTQLFKQSNSFSIGMLKSHFRGSGLQFKEHRQYTHGDDVRFIDWKILAKTGDPFIKTFEEERNVQIAVVIDAGPSMLYGWDGISKLQAALEITCMLYLLAAETNDSIHALIISDQIIDIPSNSGEKGIISLISTLTKHNIINSNGDLILSMKDTYTPAADREMALKKHLARNREIVVLSDWQYLLEQVNLKNFVADKRTHCFRLLAPLDKAEKIPVSFKVSGEIGGRQGIYQFKSKSKEVKNKIDRVVDIDIDKRYLDQFVREMI
ncbi:MAG: hypothetical protein CME63_00760 [Halobacteriovoraceae bacterium]|jgi:hypothetical protein|nr:hypothetical protein [Halobacteriovoraceae bacterium]MBC96256.1 hypothetical protein [Halobacteriovoraceae bacterium]|tara:strand:+ start:67619 stop:68455 length:837 start_codon:yes stop_codon:yes gene_type:complete